MADKCILLLLDGLGDRSHELLDNRTPLEAASTPYLDGLADKGSTGLYHAGPVGRALPSELAHFLLFGYPEAAFPGRGALEALGAGMALCPQDVAMMARLVHTREESGALRLVKDTPGAVTGQEVEALCQVLPELECGGLTFRYTHLGGLHGLLVVSPGADHKVVPSPLVTDTNPIRDMAMCIEPRPLAEAERDRDTALSAALTAGALKEYLLAVRELLRDHPVNRSRKERGHATLNMLATQRPGQCAPVTPFSRRYGLRGACMASGALYGGLARYLGMDWIQVRDSGKPGRDLGKRLAMARSALDTYDFIHVHTKAPDVAAHTKDCENKRDVIEALDRGAGEQLMELAHEPGVLLVVTADHSTPSSGTLIHSGEPVPLLMCGEGVRRDAVGRFDEIAVAGGALGLLRGPECMYMMLNYLDRARLAGLRDAPDDFGDLPSWPGEYTPFQI